MAYRITICVLNWETPEVTIQCLHSLLNLETTESCIQHLDLVVIDNGSGDDSLNRLRNFIDTLDSGIHLIGSPSNLGYAGGNNLAIRHALDHFQPDFIWILNSDTRPFPDALAQLLQAAAERPEIRIWGSTLLDESGTRVLSAGGSYYHPCLSLHRDALRGLEAERAATAALPRPLDYISGASMFVDARVFREHGLLNEEYFLFFEELDLVQRVGRDRIAWCPRARVRHAEGTSMKGSGKSHPSPTAEYHSTLSALKYTRRYHPPCLPAVAPFRLLAKLTRHAITGGWHLWRPLLAAYRDFFFRPPRKPAG